MFKLDAHDCVLCVFLAHSWVWFRDVASFSDASGIVWVRVEPVSILTHQTQCSGFRKERCLADNRQTLRTRRVPCAYSFIPRAHPAVTNHTNTFQEQDKKAYFSPLHFSSSFIIGPAPITVLTHAWRTSVHETKYVTKHPDHSLHHQVFFIRFMGQLSQ